MIKLHLGCGKRNFGNDWVHIDGAEFDHIQYKDVTKLEYEDYSVDVIYASHLLEYFDRREVYQVLHEWNRVLKSGGLLRVAVPDFDAMAQLYVSGEYPLESFIGPLYGRMEQNGNIIYHKTVYDYVSLFNTLWVAGFNRISKYDWRQTDHANIDDHSQAYLPHMDKQNGKLISLNIQAYK